MERIGIRELRQHASRWVRRAAAGESFEVTDRGPGIPPDQQGLIFEKFGRGHSDGSPGTPGTGLGLFIARSIAVAHGGALELESRPQAGATFTLTLPVPSAG